HFSLNHTTAPHIYTLSLHDALPISTHPLATAAIYYNDNAGIRAMAGAVAWQRRWPLMPAPTETLISVGLKDQSGRFLPGLIVGRSEEHTSELQSRENLVCRLLLEKK